MKKPIIVGVDLFCGVGGLTYGLQKAGISIVAGFDLDPACDFPFTFNNGAKFIQADIKNVSGNEISKLYPSGSLRLLAGCAPCRPFSSFRRGTDNSTDHEWSLLTEFGRLVKEVKPDFVTMENVPGLASKQIFKNFESSLELLGYNVNWKSIYCPKLGIPQHRRRLVLIASLAGTVRIPSGYLSSKEYRTVRQTIGSLPRLAAGEADRKDRLHKARAVSERNLERLCSSRPGGTWHDWPDELRAECHKKKTGLSYKSVYSRMVWDQPSPTITTQSFNFGTGRFGHPEQNRSITLREAALLQTFPKKYRFVKRRGKISFSEIGRLIGNAVPPRLGFLIGKELKRAALTSYRILG